MSGLTLLRIPLPSEAKGMVTRCRAYCVVAPHLWDEFPENLGTAPSLYSFWF